MPDITWIKIMTGMLQDEKIKLIRELPEGDALTVCWLQLICMAGECNSGGEVYLSDGLPYTDEMLAVVWGRNIAITRLALEKFEQLRMVVFINGERLFLPNFEKHQNIEGMEYVKQLNADRQQRWRDRKKEGQMRLTDSVTQPVTLRNVQEESRVDKNREEENREDTTDELIIIFYELEQTKILLSDSIKANKPRYQQYIDDLNYQAEELVKNHQKP